jgi:serine/threonine-protein kinase
MDAPIWTRVSQLLDEALDLPPDARTHWLETLSPDDEPLKPRLRALLAHATPVEECGFLDRLPDLDLEDPGRDDDADDEGAVIGPYRLVRQIGEGGMGTVWLAERADGLIRRPVALKLPRGFWPRASIAGRLGRERNILAGLVHPHIARLYDAGVSAAGQPYLALEYVDGRRIDEHCRAAQLDVRAIVDLFLQVIDAVAFAHARLVVHRDLKPSNILVSPDGQVHLLDFGIAKLLDDDDAPGLTEASGCPNTPEYASPEQIAGEASGTASDVFSLGVVLYELLTRARPYEVRRESRRAMEESIAGAVIVAPSGRAASPAARRTIRGDLDTIVLKALSREPEERYRTVESFGEDLRRWLDGRPVRARPASWLYRARRFVARNRFATAAVGVTLAAIIGGAGAAMWQARVARVQRDVAVQERLRADAETARARDAARIANANVELTDFLTADLAARRSIDDLARQLERAIVAVNARFGDDPLVRLNLLHGIAGRFRQIGRFDRHRELVADLDALPRVSGDGNIRAQLGCWRARDLLQSGAIAEATTRVEEAVGTLRAGMPATKPVLLACLADASAVARSAGDGPRAIATIEEAARIEEASGLGRTDGYADTLMILARAHGQAGQYGQALAASERGLTLRAEIGRTGSTGAFNAGIVHAGILREGGQPSRALNWLRDLLERSRTAGGGPRATPGAEHELALTLLRLGRPGDALLRLEPIRAALAEGGESAMLRTTSIASVLALTDAGHVERARLMLQEAAPLYQSLRRTKQYGARLYLLAATHLALARGDLEGARSALDEARAILSSVPSPGDPAWRLVHGYDARLALAERRFDDAVRLATVALDLSRQQAIDPAASVSIGEDLVLRAQALAAAGDATRAREDAAAALPHFEKNGAGGHPAAAVARTVERTGSAVQALTRR